MSDIGYPISEAAKKAGVESHVLRYWETELKLPIARNEMGHRYYTKQDIQIFLSIKELKRRGFQLKMIKELVPRLEETAYTKAPADKQLADKPPVTKEAAPPQAIRTEQTKTPAGINVVVHRKDQTPKEPTPKEPLKETPPKAKNQPSKRHDEFYQILERLFQQTSGSNRTEDRYKRLDAAIRKHQYSRRLAAATAEQEKKRKPKKPKG